MAGVVERAFSGNVYALVQEIEAKSGDRLLKIKFTGSVPDELYTRIPEAAYHLRSTLDQLIAALAKAGGAPNTVSLYSSRPASPGAW